MLCRRGACSADSQEAVITNRPAHSRPVVDSCATRLLSSRVPVQQKRARAEGMGRSTAVISQGGGMPWRCQQLNWADLCGDSQPQSGFESHHAHDRHPTWRPGRAGAACRPDSPPRPIRTSTSSFCEAGPTAAPVPSPSPGAGLNPREPTAIRSISPENMALQRSATTLWPDHADPSLTCSLRLQPKGWQPSE